MRSLLLSLLFCASVSYAEEPASEPSPRVVITSSEITVVGPICFDANSDVITTEMSTGLTIFAQILKEQSYVKTFEIAGHAEPATEKRAAKKLAAHRARAAKSYLASQGVDPKKLVAKGYADKKPIKTGTSAAASRENRCIEIIILELK
jgi:OOP family OmpA-OmpF porin